MSIVHANNKTTISLGRQGENLARQVVFDLSDWVSGYGDGVPELIYQRPGDEQPYPVAAVREGSTLVWTVTNADTAVAASYGSYGRCELRWYVGEVLAKSQTWRTWVEPAMSTPTETAPPEPEQGWVEQVLATGAAAQQAAAAAKADADLAATLAAEVAENAAQTAQDATASAQAKETAQTARRLAEDAQRAAETAKQAAEAAQSAVAQSANDADAAKQGAESALSDAQAAASAAAQALSDIRELYQQMQTWADGVIQTVSEAGSDAVQSVQTAGDAQVQRVAEEGAHQTANAKAQADAADLSADAAEKSAKRAAESAAVYDDVVGDVTQLKQDIAKKITAPTTASVGQTIRVKSVDDAGRPTEWEAADAAKMGWELLGDVTVDIAVDFDPISIADGVVTLDPTSENYSELIDGRNHCAVILRDITNKKLNAGCINCILDATDYANGVFAIKNGDGVAFTGTYDVSKYKIAKKAVFSVSMSGIKQYKRFRLLYEAPYSCTHGLRKHFGCSIPGLMWDADKSTSTSGGISFEVIVSPVGDGGEYVYVHNKIIQATSYGGSNNDNIESVRIYPASYGKVPVNGILTFNLATDIFYKGTRFRVWGSNE